MGSELLKQLSDAKLAVVKARQEIAEIFRMEHSFTRGDVLERVSYYESILTDSIYLVEGSLSEYRINLLKAIKNYEGCDDLSLNAFYRVEKRIDLALDRLHEAKTLLEEIDATIK